MMAVTTGLASITVTIGDSRRMTFETNSQSRLSYFEVPFDRQNTGAVVLGLNGKTTRGPEIRAFREQTDNVSTREQQWRNSPDIDCPSGLSQRCRYPGLALFWLGKTWRDLADWKFLGFLG